MFGGIHALNNKGVRITLRLACLSCENEMAHICLAHEQTLLLLPKYSK